MCGIDLRTTLQTYRQQTRLLSKYFLIYYFINTVTPNLSRKHCILFFIDNLFIIYLLLTLWQ